MRNTTINKTNEKNTVLLIDGSSLAFIHANKIDYKHTIKEHLLEMLDRFNSDKFIIVMEDSRANFRNEVAISNEYKGQRRTDKAKLNRLKYSPYLIEAKDELINTYNAITYLGVENDDVIAMLSLLIEDNVMCCNDVDYLMIPGYVYNMRTLMLEKVVMPGKIDKLVTKKFSDKLQKDVSKCKIKATGYYQVYLQVLKGSSKENYKGIPRLGPVKAYNYLKNCKTEEEMQITCLYLFIKQFGKRKGIEKLNEGFRLSWLITKNKHITKDSIKNLITNINTI